MFLISIKHYLLDNNLDIEVDGNYTIKKLKEILSDLFDFPVNQQVLKLLKICSYAHAPHVGFYPELNHENATLSAYGIEEGDVILLKRNQEDFF